MGIQPRSIENVSAIHEAEIDIPQLGHNALIPNENFSLLHDSEPLYVTTLCEGPKCVFQKGKGSSLMLKLQIFLFRHTINKI